MLRKGYNRSVQLKRNTGRKSQGGCRQGETICGKPPFVKSLWLSLKYSSWKGTAIQRRLQHRSWRISTARSRYQGTADEASADWKNLACAVVICKMWRLAMAL
jgi:hypothetical protein